MRETLFRGKRVDNDDWVYGDLIHRQVWSTQLTIIRISDDGFNHYEEFEVKPETVGQFTGLTDKNDKKIFEGDVVKSYFCGELGKKPMTVEFRIERGGWFPFACGDGCGCCEVDTYPPKYTEAIGNVHDNHELLGSEV